MAARPAITRAGFSHFSANTTTLARAGIRRELSAEWLGLASTINPAGPADEMTARRLAEMFASYLRACKSDKRSLSTLPPGRFLMPGDLEGSPALTFAPLPDLGDQRFEKGSIGA